MRAAALTQVQLITSTYLTRDHTSPNQPSVTTTMGSSQDLQNEAFRRLLVNASFWALGMEGKIPPKANVDLVGEFHRSPFKFGGQQRGRKPDQF